MNITHVIPHLGEEASGPSQSVLRLCESLAQCGNAVELMCLAAGRPPADVRLSVYPQHPWFGKFGVSRDMLKALHERADSAQVIHNHSLWAFPNVAAGWAKKRGGAKLVTSPRGTLLAAALRISRAKKWLLWPFQRDAVWKADCMHATSQEEADSIRVFGYQGPIAVIPNGIDLPQGGTTGTWARPAEGKCRLLSLSRLHPQKGLDLLLEAWGRLAPAHPQWELVIAGKGETSYVQQLKQYAAAHLPAGSVEFVGPVYGADKVALYGTTNLFVLATFSENFGMAVAESLAHGIPVVTTTGAPWRGLVERGCGWWVAPTVDGIAHALDAAMANPPDTLALMGGRGADWMKESFSWQANAAMLTEVYAWLLGAGPQPACVRLN